MVVRALYALLEAFEYNLTTQRPPSKSFFGCRILPKAEKRPLDLCIRPPVPCKIDYNFAFSQFFYSPYYGNPVFTYYLHVPPPTSSNYAYRSLFVTSLIYDHPDKSQLIQQSKLDVYVNGRDALVYEHSYFLLFDCLLTELLTLLE